MRLELNPVDFLTEEHTKTIQEKLTKAVDEITTEQLKSNLLQHLNLEDVMYEVMDEMDKNTLAKAFEKKLTELLK
jgi:hypothetical protein